MTRFRDTIFQRLPDRKNPVRVFVRVESKGNVFHLPAHKLERRAPAKRSLWSWAEEKLFGRAA